MQTVSETYRSLWGKVTTWQETKVTVGGVDYQGNTLFSVHTDSSVFSTDTPTVGGCIARQIDLEIMAESSAVPKMGKIRPYIRLANGETRSEWIAKGVFFVDTRSYDEESGIITLHGYDAMLKTEKSYTTSGDQGYWPKTDRATVDEICQKIGVELDQRTAAVLTSGYLVNYPGYGEGAYTMREVLSTIAAMYAGNFIMTEVGKLHLIRLGDLPAETNYLVTQTGDNITLGGVRLLV